MERHRGIDSSAHLQWTFGIDGVHRLDEVVDLASGKLSML
jgi:hypothetical protein